MRDSLRKIISYEDFIEAEAKHYWPGRSSPTSFSSEDFPRYAAILMLILLEYCGDTYSASVGRRNLGRQPKHAPFGLEQLR